MSLILRLAIGFALLTVLATTQAQAPRYRITGTAVNARTGEPLANIEVSMGRAEEADAAQSMITGMDGRFHFDNLRRGKYWVEAEGHGFVRQRFEQHEEYATAIALGPTVESDSIVFRLRPDAAIEGTVTDDQGEAIRDGQVMLFRGGAHDGADSVQMMTTVPTDDQGHYQFGHLGPGTYFIAVSARPWYAEMRPGLRPRIMATFHAAREPEPDPQEQAQFDVAYPITYYSGTSDPNSATPIVIDSGEHASADVALAAVPAVHLRISNAVADPSQGIGVNLTQRVLGGAVMPVPGETSDLRNGEVELTGIPAGQYTLALHAGASPGDREKQISVSNDTQVDAEDASSSPVISGIVRLDTGEPLPQFTAIRFSNHAEGDIGARINAKGKFELDAGQSSFQSGFYDVTIAGPGTFLVKNISATGARVLGRQIEIQGGNPVRLVVTVSEARGRIDGIALRDGKPAPGVMIVLVPPEFEHNSSLVRRDQSDSDGTFSLFNVLPGKYTVVAIENGWKLQWLKPEVMQPYLKRGQPVEVTVGARTRISVDVQPLLAR
ncbi:MAG TPA: carboxypeptidase-like regulatory domain-containing protein [Terriglobales bacterium]